MPAASSNPFPFVTFNQTTAPVAAPTGTQRVYMASGSNALFSIDSGGTIHSLTGSAGMTNPMTTTGDIIYSSDNSGTPARLAAGSSNYVLTALGAGVAPKWAAIPASGGSAAPLAMLAYTSTEGSYAITTTTDADVDATNLKVVFTAPASGNVIVRIRALFNDGSNNARWTVRESTSTLQTNYMSSGVNKAIGGVAEFYLTGISAGSHTYKMGAYTSAGTMNIYHGPESGSYFGPIIMEVWGA